MVSLFYSNVRVIRLKFDIYIHKQCVHPTECFFYFNLKISDIRRPSIIKGLDKIAYKVVIEYKVYKILHQ